MALSYQRRTIAAPITGGVAQIFGNLTQAFARELAAQLQSGPLPVAFQVTGTSIHAPSASSRATLQLAGLSSRSGGDPAAAQLPIAPSHATGLRQPNGGSGAAVVTGDRHAARLSFQSVSVLIAESGSVCAAVSGE